MLIHLQNASPSRSFEQKNSLIDSASRESPGNFLEFFFEMAAMPIHLLFGNNFNDDSLAYVIKTIMFLPRLAMLLGVSTCDFFQSEFKIVFFF